MKIVFIGEAFGQAEEQYGKPFLGASGVEFYKMLCSAGFSLTPITKTFSAPITMLGLWKRADITLLSVFNSRPKDPEKRNRSEFFFGKKGDPDTSPSPRHWRKAGECLKLEYMNDLVKLHADLKALRPNLIVTLGATSSWALGLGTSIAKIRGTLHSTEWGKVLPTFHPASVIRAWSQRPIVVADFIKAQREMQFPEIRKVRREIWYEPEIPDLEKFWNEHLKSSSLISIDIETERNEQISEVGFASDSTHAIHIPFLFGEKNRSNLFTSCRSYWSPKDELLAWKFVQKVCECSIPKVLHNGLYDTYWLYKVIGIKVQNSAEDTLLLHHALYPEMRKSLGFLATLYTQSVSCKFIRKESKAG